MKKVLIVYEDYSEGLKTQTFLKKIGLDAVEIGNEYQLSEQLLSFRPEAIVVCGGNLKKVSTLSVGQKLRDKQRFQGKVVLIFPQGKLPQAGDLAKVRADQILEAPVEPARLIQSLSKLLGLDESVLLEKFSRTPYAADQGNIHVGSSGGQGKETKQWLSNNSSDRVKKYDNFISGMSIDKNKTTYDSQSIKAAQKEFTKDWDGVKKQELEDLDKLKREFASAMFVKDDDKK